MKSFYLALASLATVAIFSSGCASTHNLRADDIRDRKGGILDFNPYSMVTVESEPAGAMVRARGVGRAAYRWRTMGKTPCRFTARYSEMEVYVGFPDRATRTDVRTVKLSNWRDADPVRFEASDFKPIENKAK